MWKIEERKELLTAPITLPPLDEQTPSELRQHYDEAADAETRTRYQILLLAQRGQTSNQIAEIVLRSQDTVVRVLKRFLTGGLEAIPRRSAPTYHSFFVGFGGKPSHMEMVIAAIISAQNEL